MTYLYHGIKTKTFYKRFNLSLGKKSNEDRSLSKLIGRATRRGGGPFPPPSPSFDPAGRVSARCNGEPITHSARTDGGTAGDGGAAADEANSEYFVAKFPRALLRAPDDG